MRVHKVLTFRASSLGDALNAKYLLENVHAAYPEARCAIVVTRKAAMIQDLLAAYPWIEVVETHHRDVRSLLMLWQQFRGSDLVVIPPAKPQSSFSFLSKVAARALARCDALVGFEDASGINAYLYDQVIPLRTSQAPRISEQDVLRSAGIPITVSGISLQHVPQVWAQAAQALVRRKYIVVHLFAGSEPRGPSQAMRQAIVDALARELPDTPLVCTGTREEREKLEALMLPMHARVVAGNLSVQGLMTLMIDSACVVSVGSGPSHIATSMGVPTLVVVTCHGTQWVGIEQYGATAPVQIFSNHAACAAGHEYTRAHPACIEGIDVQALAQAAATYLT